MADKKLSELPLASAINAEDISLLVSDGTDYKFAFASLLQFIGDNLNIGAKVSFGTVLPSNTSGKNGDLFIKTDTGAFVQKVSGVWTVVYTIPSATGITNGTILYGLGVPGSATGSNNDTYINTGTGVFYKKTSGTWSQVFSMQTGPQGPQGLAGTNGTNGANGFSVLSGATTPSNSGTGVNGDFYINTSTYTLYGPKTGGLWGEGISLIGNGIPNGGTTGQVLVKNSDDDLDADWGDIGVSYGNITGDVADSASLSAALSGKADLVSGKVPSGQLPGYVDDVLEFANFASLPGTGEVGKIYVTLNDNCEFRWSGSTYIQLVASPGSTDAVPEGSTNKYFTAARVLSTVLSGVSFLANAAVSATDTVLAALGKLQAQITALFKIPAGGTAGQILAKVDSADGNTGWINAPSGGGVSGLEPKQILFGKGDGTIDQNTDLIFDPTANSLLKSVGEAPFVGGNIYFYGDSITGGTGSVGGQSFATVLSGFLGLTQNNFGVSASTLEKRSPVDITGGVNMLDRLSSIPTKGATDRFIIFCYGINDLKYAGINYTPANFETDYMAVINNCLSKGWNAADILITTLPYLKPSDYGTVGPGGGTITLLKHQQFNTACLNVASAFGTRSFDLFNYITDRGGVFNLYDSLHPNRFGHYLIAAGMANVLTRDVYSDGQSFAASGVVEFLDLVLKTKYVIADAESKVLGTDQSGNLGVVNELPASFKINTPWLNGGFKQIGAGIETTLNTDDIFLKMSTRLRAVHDNNQGDGGYQGIIQLIDNGACMNFRLTYTGGGYHFWVGSAGDERALRINHKKQLVIGDAEIDSAVADGGLSRVGDVYFPLLSGISGTYNGYSGRIEPFSSAGIVRVRNNHPSGIIRFTISGGSGYAQVDAWDIKVNGDLEGLISGQKLIMKSPDGTKYYLSPPNGGGAATWVAV